MVIDDFIAVILMLPFAVNPKGALKALTFNLCDMGQVPEKGFMILRTIAIVSLFSIALGVFM
jgi:hypothetical protein